jgi:hypothetical protein
VALVHDLRFVGVLLTLYYLFFSQFLQLLSLELLVSLDNARNPSSAGLSLIRASSRTPQILLGWRGVDGGVERDPLILVNLLPQRLFLLLIDLMLVMEPGRRLAGLPPLD